MSTNPRNRTMDDDTRKQKALKLADEAARREAHEAGAFAAEEARLPRS